MNKEVKDKWVAALRSGKYEQGIGLLEGIDYDRETEEKKSVFCCLGVLCDLAEKEDIVKRRKGCGAYEYDGKDDVLPTSVSNWAKMKSYAGQFDRPIVYYFNVETGQNVPYSSEIDLEKYENFPSWSIYKAYKLTDCNDKLGMNFNQIADLIEDRWEEL